MQKMTSDDFAKKIAKLGKYFGKICESPEDYFAEFGELGDEYFDEITAEIKRTHKFARFPLIAEFYEATKRIEETERLRIEQNSVKKTITESPIYEKLTSADIAESRIFWNFFKEVAIWRAIGTAGGLIFKKRNGMELHTEIKQLTASQMQEDIKNFIGCDVYEWNKKGCPSLNCAITNFYLNHSHDAFRASKVPEFFQMATEELKYMRKQQIGNYEPDAGLLKNFKMAI